MPQLHVSEFIETRKAFYVDTITVHCRVMTFQNQPPELWKEVTQLTSALRILEGGTTSEQDFYVKMFQHISYEVQHKILLLTVNHSDNNLDHCKLMLLLLKRFPQTIQTHSVRTISIKRSCSEWSRIFFYVLHCWTCLNIVFVYERAESRHF